MMWGGEDLAGDLGVARNRDDNGTYRAPFQLARNLTLLAAAASECSAIDAVHVDYTNLEALAAESAQAQKDESELLAFFKSQGLEINTPDVAAFRKIQNTPKWTASGTLSLTHPFGNGEELNASATLSYRSSSQQFELRIPGLDQKGYALLDANLVYTGPDHHWTFGVHARNLTDKRYISSGYNFLRQNPFTGNFILPNGTPGISSALGKEGILTAYYGSPRQLFFSVGYKF